MIRVALPPYLRTLANLNGEAIITVEGEVTIVQFLMKLMYVIRCCAELFAIMQQCNGDLSPLLCQRGLFASFIGYTASCCSDCR